MSLYTETSKSIRTLYSSPSNLFEIYTLNILLSFDYYIITFLLPVYYTEVFNLSDKHAGYIFGLSGLVLGLVAFLAGSVFEYIGGKASLIFSSASIGIGYLLLSITRDLSTSLVAVLGLICIGSASAWPVLGTSIKRYSDASNRSTSNSIMMMGTYLAGIISGTYIDIVWNYFDDTTMTFDIIFSTAAGASVLALLISINLKAYGSQEGNRSPSESVVLTKKFLKFSMVMVCVTFIHSICFEQLDATFPKYLLRTIGEKSHFGVFMAIHSANMMIGALAFTPLTFMFSSYTLIIIGGVIGMAATAVLSISSNNLVFVAFVLLLSTGESILVPRTLDYTLKVAGNGEEGVYLALCNSPYYFGMILTGVLSGELLEKYCPESGERRCIEIWKVTCLCTAAAVGVMATLRYCISQKESVGNLDHNEEEVNS